MEVFNLKNDKVEGVELKPFKLEKDIQSLVEKNTEIFFELEFIYSELTVGNYRIDSLCFDNENNSFVIIEYKKGNSYSVIDQGYTYLQLLLNNKSDFLLTLSQHYNKVLRLEDVDWSQSKIIFVSPSFNSYQRDSVNFKNLPFELWEIKRFSNDTIVFNKHKSSSNESIESLTNSKNKNVISSVSREVKVFDDNKWILKTDEQLVQKWKDLKESLIELNDVELVSKKDYISLMYGNKTICYFNLQKNKIRLDFNRGNIKTDGTISKNFFTLDDPKEISVEGSWEWKDGTKGNVYKISLNKNFDVDYVKFLIKQKYNSFLK
ncbi:hypothetical protein OAT55_03800 [Flavobacteriaceae bacterium]|nr:hypothetical protein [Flavobacteriaceae bacterium]|tara:strand:+ start:983 stop:1942 length:960 start_codon:yes stop_codon:yes gene_type:complete